MIGAAEGITGDVSFGDHTGVGANSVVMPANDVPEGVAIGALSFVPPGFEFEPWNGVRGHPDRPAREPEPRQRAPASGAATRIKLRLIVSGVDSTTERAAMIASVPEQPPPARPARPVRAPDPRSMLLAGLCALALVAVGLAWSLASPAGSSPDDDFHLASIWCATGDPAVCRQTGEEIEEGVERVHVLPDLGEGLICYAHAPRVSAACQTVARQE